MNRLFNLRLTPRRASTCRYGRRACRRWSRSWQYVWALSYARKIDKSILFWYQFPRLSELYAWRMLFRRLDTYWLEIRTNYTELPSLVCLTRFLTVFNHGRLFVVSLIYYHRFKKSKQTNLSSLQTCHVSLSTTREQCRLFRSFFKILSISVCILGMGESQTTPSTGACVAKESIKDHFRL